MIEKKKKYIYTQCNKFTFLTDDTKTFKEKCIPIGQVLFVRQKR